MPANPLVYRSLYVCLTWPEFQQLEDWRRAQPEIPSRASAIRAFTVQAIKASTDGKLATASRDKRPSAQERSTTAA